MPIHYDKRNKRFRFTFNRVIAGKRYRASRLLPGAWSKAEAQEFDYREVGRLVKVATGGGAGDPLISDAVRLYLTDKTELKSIHSATEHLAAIAWAYQGKVMSDLPAVVSAVRRVDLAPATIKQRLALLKAACRWAWKMHGLTDNDPTGKMQMPAVSNERHVYRTRAEMLRICRACRNWKAQIAIRAAFYTGMRLSELLRAEPMGDALALKDTKNGQPRIVPAHPRIRHLLQFFPLGGSKRGIQAAFTRACVKVGLPGTHFHDLRHSGASEMVNAGISLFTVGRVLGHKDQRSTARYSHLTDEAMVAAVGMIGKRA
jgi:integrase